MLEIKCFACNMIQENCYVVSDETHEGIIIDCGAFYESERKAIKKYISEKGIVLRHLVATHGHIDHNLGNRFVWESWGLKPEVHRSDEELMKSLPEQASSLCGIMMSDDDF